MRPISSRIVRGLLSSPARCWPLLQRLSQYLGQETDQDVGLHPLGILMPDGPDREVALVDAEGGVRLWI